MDKELLDKMSGWGSTKAAINLAAILTEDIIRGRYDFKYVSKTIHNLSRVLKVISKIEDLKIAAFFLMLSRDHYKHNIRFSTLPPKVKTHLSTIIKSKCKDTDNFLREKLKEIRVDDRVEVFYDKYWRQGIVKYIGKNTYNIKIGPLNEMAGETLQISIKNAKIKRII